MTEEVVDTECKSYTFKRRKRITQHERREGILFFNVDVIIHLSHQILLLFCKVTHAPFFYGMLEILF